MHNQGVAATITAARKTTKLLRIIGVTATYMTFGQQLKGVQRQASSITNVFAH